MVSAVSLCCKVAILNLDRSGGSCRSNEVRSGQSAEQCGTTGFRSLCCASPAPITACHWVGNQPNCDNAVCGKDEISIDTSSVGDMPNSPCGLGRSKSLCCKVVSVPAQEISCPTAVCSWDDSLCSWEDDDAFGSDGDTGQYKRDVNQSIGPEHDGGLGPMHALDKRGSSRGFSFALLGFLIRLVFRSRPYPSRGELFDNTGGTVNNILQRYFSLANPGSCTDTRVSVSQLNIANNPNNLPGDGETEHVIDVRSLELMKTRNPLTLI